MPTLQYRMDGQACCLVFCLHGGLLVQDGCPPREDGKIAAGRCGLLTAPCTCKRLTCVACGGTHMVDVRYSGPLMQKLIMPDDPHQSCRTKGLRKPLKDVARITPTMDYLLRTMEKRAASGDAHPLFMTAKALELMWLFTDSWSRSAESRICPSDQRAVHEAQTILENNMGAAPSLNELAVRVGMSLSKFKQVFSLVCGRPPYAYLRQARMRRAYDLLQHTEMNVTEVALEVGYASPSRFARAFTGQFGFNPSLARRMPPIEYR